MPTTKDVRARRRLLSWLPTTLVALVCIGFVVAAIAMQNSWWSRPTGTPAADQQASDGASRFDQAGIDYFTRDGSVRVKLRDDAESATALGLSADGAKTIEPLVPLSVVVLGADGPVVVKSATSFTVTTAGDRIVRLDVTPDLLPSWQSVESDIDANAARWGWSSADLQQLTDDLAAASQASDGGSYGARLPAIDHEGVRIDAEVTIAGGASVVYGFSLPD